MAKKEIIVEVESPQGTLNKEDAIKILKGTGLAFGGALVIYVLELLAHIDFGQYTAIIGAVIAVSLNVVRKIYAGDKK